MPLNPLNIRSEFPGLQREAIFLDNPAGTQIVQSSLKNVIPSKNLIRSREKLTVHWLTFLDIIPCG